MSQADELLNSLAVDGISTFTADPSTEPHIIIDSDRFITVPDQLKRIAVQYDHNIETVTFDCPRYWDGRDMSTMKAYINFRRPDKEIGSYIVDNIAIDESDNTVMHFDWTISGYVSEVSGPLSFLVCIKMVDSDGNETVHWNSELNQELYISTGLEVESYLEEQYPDIITQLLLRMSSVEEASGSIAENTALAAGYAESARTDKDAAEAAMTAASNSADKAKTSETNAATSASTASTKAAEASGSASSASNSASTAAEKASAASTSANNARTSEVNAGNSASTAAEKASAASTSASNARTSETNAGASASQASESASTATTRAMEANVSATNAANSEHNAENSATLSQSWAVGGTGTRTGEDTNNAKYWSEQAKSIVGGDFATNAEAKGYADTAEANAKKYADSLAAKNIDCGTW